MPSEAHKSDCAWEEAARTPGCGETPHHSLRAPFHMQMRTKRRRRSRLRVMHKLIHAAFRQTKRTSRANAELKRVIARLRERYSQ